MHRFSLGNVFERSIILTGGKMLGDRDHQETSDMAITFDVETGVFHEEFLPRLNIGRFGHSCVVIGYKVFVVCGDGGKDDSNFYLDSIEMLDLTQVGLGWDFFNHLTGLT